MTETIFEKSQKEQHGFSLPKEEKCWDTFFPPLDLQRKSPLRLPEVSEIDLTRHYVGLSRRNVGIDNLFYPLGSCTMKLNPRISEWIASFPSFTQGHPLLPDPYVQGNLEITYNLVHFLIELTGMTAGTLLPNAGAQGEFVGIRLIEAYHKANRDFDRTEFLVPDAAHGTNPATVAMAGFQVKNIPTNGDGDLNFEMLKNSLSNKTAGLLLTNPNTLGIFSQKILEISKAVHDAGGLLYYDGANLNPIMTLAKPGEMGFDVMHVNLHKTFSTPHGGGGPGSGPVLCNDRLKPFLPLPRVEKTHTGYSTIWNNGESIGGIVTFRGNFLIYLRAYVYILLHGLYGLRRVAEQSIINANYLKTKLTPHLTIPFKNPCMHEFVVQADSFLPQGVKAMDIAKRLLDYNIHSPTVYFPQVIKECMLIEPTECESKRTLDLFLEALLQIIQEIKQNPELVKTAPHTTPVGRLDEVRAAKHPILIDRTLSI